MNCSRKQEVFASSSRALGKMLMHEGSATVSLLHLLINFDQLIGDLINVSYGMRGT